MGASNFYKKNADKYYIVCNHAPEEEGDADFGRWMIEDLENMLESELESKLTSDMEFHKFDDTKTKHDLRLYPSVYIGSITKIIYYMKGKGEVVIVYNLFIRFGYYDAACLDWEIETSIDGDDIDEFDLESFRNCSLFHVNNDSSKGISKIMFNRLKLKVDKANKDIQSFIIELFTSISQPMKKIITFSNGESIYEKV